jgi:hypothetical protein
MNETESARKRSIKKHTGFEFERSVTLYSSHYTWVNLEERLRGHSFLKEDLEFDFAGRRGPTFTFTSTYLTLLTDPSWSSRSNRVEPFESFTLRYPDSTARLARGPGVTSCGEMAAPMDHSFKGR